MKERISLALIGMFVTAIFFGAGPASAWGGFYYSESGQVLVPTLTSNNTGASGCSALPSDLLWLMGSGLTIWRLNPDAISVFNGYYFTLDAVGNEDLDLCFFDAAGRQLANFRAVGDEHGRIPYGSAEAYVVLWCCEPEDFWFDVWFL